MSRNRVESGASPLDILDFLQYLQVYFLRVRRALALEELEAAVQAQLK